MDFSSGDLFFFRGGLLVIVKGGRSAMESSLGINSGEASETPEEHMRVDGLRSRPGVCMTEHRPQTAFVTRKIYRLLLKK